jgi:hypothetical protein
VENSFIDTNPQKKITILSLKQIPGINTPWHQMRISGQLHVPAATFTDEEPLVSIKKGCPFLMETMAEIG